MQTFKGREYAPDSAVATAVDIELDGETILIKATVFDADSQLEKAGKLHISDFEIEVGGFSSTTTMLKHVPTKTTLMVEDQALLSALAKTKSPVAEKAKKAHKQIKNVPRKVALTWSLLIGGTFFAVFLVYFSMEGIVGWIAERTSPTVERIIGETQVRFMSANSRRVESANQRRIDRIASRLVSNLKDNPYQFEFIVVDDPNINAFAYPGGIVFVCSGLIDNAQSDHEIAGVLSHEIGHVIRKHQLKAMLHGIGLLNLVTFAFSDFSPTLADVMSKAVDLERLSYKRSQELDADIIGTQLVIDSDYNPEGILNLFTRLQNQMGTSNRVPLLLSTHPMIDDRIQKIAQQVAETERARKARKAQREAQQKAAP